MGGGEERKEEERREEERREEERRGEGRGGEGGGKKDYLYGITLEQLTCMRPSLQEPAHIVDIGRSAAFSASFAGLLLDCDRSPTHTIPPACRLSPSRPLLC